MLPGQNTNILLLHYFTPSGQSLRSYKRGKLLIKIVRMTYQER